MQGDATTVVTNRLIKSLHGKPDGARAMAANVCIDNVSKELGYDDAPVLEQLLIEHIVVCRLNVKIQVNVANQQIVNG